MKLVVCRADLPENPRAGEEGYPGRNCWDVDELMSSPDVPLGEKRRVMWECLWRAWGRYRRGKPFFETYLLDGAAERVPEERWMWACGNIVTSAMAHGVVPEEAKAQAQKTYREIFGSPFAGKE